MFKYSDSRLAIEQRRLHGQGRCGVRLTHDDGLAEIGVEQSPGGLPAITLNQTTQRQDGLAARVCVKVLRTASLRSKIEPFAHLLVLAAVTFSANIAGTGSISGALAAIYEYHATGGGWCP
jgi:hypothetical protein